MIGSLKRFLLLGAGASGGVGAGGSRAFVVGRKAGGRSLRASVGFRRPQGDTNPDSTAEAVTSVVLGAQYMPREAGDDGPRVAVISPALGGAFFFNREEAARRLQLNFPDLDEKQLRRAIGLMQSRVRLATNPPDKARRGGWVHGWRDNPERAW